jgi:hypothetical protein
MDYLERAYYDPWEFSFSGEPRKSGHFSSDAETANVRGPAKATATRPGATTPSPGIGARVGNTMADTITDAIMENPEAFARLTTAAVDYASTKMFNGVRRWSHHLAQRRRDQT